ncbi:MAG: hypothetical protein JWR48_6529, partial [Mycobacterium sp.]|nr:hypothetical protein [Mycobacterium sp.]
MAVCVVSIAGRGQCSRSPARRPRGRGACGPTWVTAAGASCGQTRRTDLAERDLSSHAADRVDDDVWALGLERLALRSFTSTNVERHSAKHAVTEHDGVRQHGGHMSRDNG